jgi:hypothetical protein
VSGKEILPLAKVRAAVLLVKVCRLKNERVRECVLCTTPPGFICGAH